MVKTMKKSLTLMVMMMVLVLAMAASAFAASHDYAFHYEDEFHSHSSSYIAGPADVTDGVVTITLTGNYFPSLIVDSITYTGVYDSGTNLTTFVFPGSAASPIPVSLHVLIAPFHNAWYDLDIVWD